MNVLLKSIFTMLLAAILGLAILNSRADALIVINEILADPHASQGDANADGIISTRDDEFVELLNTGADPVDLAGWTLHDDRDLRHEFAPGFVLAPNAFGVVFGGGTPAIDAIQWSTASSGNLGLNNSGDTIYVYDQFDILVTQVSYGSEGGDNTSLTRVPDGEGEEFHLHSEYSGNLFSPGTKIDGTQFDVVIDAPPIADEDLGHSASTVPEPGTLLLFSSGLMGFLFRQRWS